MLPVVPLRTSTCQVCSSFAAHPTQAIANVFAGIRGHRRHLLLQQRCGRKAKLFSHILHAHVCVALLGRQFGLGHRNHRLVNHRRRLTGGRPAFSNDITLQEASLVSAQEERVIVSVGGRGGRGGRVVGAIAVLGDVGVRDSAGRGQPITHLLQADLGVHVVGVDRDGWLSSGLLGWCGCRGWRGSCRSLGRQGATKEALTLHEEHGFWGQSGRFSRRDVGCHVRHVVSLASHGGPLELQVCVVVAFLALCSIDSDRRLGSSLFHLRRHSLNGQLDVVHAAAASRATQRFGNLV
mmetsp:Transcript_13315/g.41958  ORF Transcript_13315/g.41958 Transcript_13315/m.41958 type:complete len:294 (+) Transcript_13315:164-1045(+)